MMINDDRWWLTVSNDVRSMMILSGACLALLRDKVNIKAWLGLGSGKFWISRLSSARVWKKWRFTSWARLGLGESEHFELEPIIPIWVKLDLFVRNLSQFIQMLTCLSYFNPCSIIFVIFTYDKVSKHC